MKSEVHCPNPKPFMGCQCDNVELPVSREEGVISGDFCTQSDLPAVRPSDWAVLPPQRTKAECRLVRTIIDMMFPTIPKDEIVVNPTPSTPYLSISKSGQTSEFLV